MTHRALPKHPDIGHLKRQAKALLRAAKAGDNTALVRMRVLPAFVQTSPDELGHASFALHDAQSVIAREYGFPSWKALAEQVEETTLDSHSAVREFIEAATDGRTGRAARLLRLHPGIREVSFHAALLLGDFGRVGRWLSENPQLAREPGGPRAWQPLLYICYDSLSHDLMDTGGLVDIARQFLDLGADPDARFPWLHHGVHRPALWGATLVTQWLPLSQLLLEAGADANDGVTLPLAAGADDVAALDLLLAHGADPNQAWASDGSTALYASLQWATSPRGIFWLLEHGAQPDRVFAENGEAPLHVVAKRWDVALAKALVERGADVSRRRKDGRTPYAIAELNGNRPVADFLLQHGASPELEPVDQLVALCSRGDRKAARLLLNDNPGLSARIETQHYAAIYQAAERGDTNAIRALLDNGFDPNRSDEEIGKTALHCAAMAGQAEAVRLLLARGASPAVRDREFDATPLIWAADGARSHADEKPNYAAIGRLLLDAGSPVDWRSGEEPAEELLEILDGWRRTQSERQP